MLKGSGFDQQVFEQYYDKYYLPRMTSTKPLDLGNLADRRRVLQKELFAAGASPTAHTALVILIQKRAASVILGNYHPSVKYNFVLLLGQLNEKEASRQPAVPLKSAFPTMIQLAANSKSDAVRIAALLGIQRHIELRAQFPEISGALSGEEKSRAAKVLQAVVETKSPTSGQSESALGWTQSIAANSLGLLGDPKAAVSLGKLVLDENADRSARCAATKALGRLDLSGQPAISKKLVGPLAKLTADCCAVEQAALSRFQKGPEGSKQPDGDEETPFEDPRSVPSRRRLLTHLLDIRAGITGPDGTSGLKGTAPDAAELLQQIDSVVEALREPSSSAMELAEAISRHAKP